MNKIERILEVYRILDGFYEENISFIEVKDPFQFLISVVLSAQTTDKIVNQVGKTLFKYYPTPSLLAKADYDDICNIIKPTGFYKNKAKNIIECSKILANIPISNKIDELIKLPGVGRKTANCVIGEVYNKGAVIVDTHVKRVLNRLNIVDEKDPTKIEFKVRSLLDEKYLYRFSMIVNLHGRRFCFARKPNCLDCPLYSICPSRDEENQDICKK